MRTRSILAFLISALVSLSPAVAQRASRLSIQAGYLHVSSILTRTSPVLIGIPQPEALPGFYAGLTYERQRSDLFTTQLELAYLAKGYRDRRFIGDQPVTHSYRYASIRPLVGIIPLNRLRVLVGPELNLLLSQSSGGSYSQLSTAHHQWGEAGLLGRATYQFERVGLSLGYSYGLTAYYRSDYHYLTSRSWQVGVHYQLSKF